MTVANPSTAFAEVLVDELMRNGVEHVVISPGSRSGALVIAALGAEGMRVHVEIDERSAGFLAVGIGKASGRPAAVVTTSGTAAANLAPAVVEADMAGVPMLVLTADRPPELRHAGANQTIDQVKLYGERVRWFCEVGVPEDSPGANAYWRSTVCRAVSEAGGIRPGPVHLNIGFREPLVPESDDGRVAVAPFEGPVSGRPGGSPWTESIRVESAAGSAGPLDGRVLVVAGTGAGRLPVHPWPVIAEAHSGARTPGVISTAHHLLADPMFLESHVPDVAVVVGRAGLSRNVARLVARAPKRVVVDPAGWPDPDRGATQIVAEFPTPGTVDSDWSSDWLEAESIGRTALDGFLDGLMTPSEPRVARDTADALPEGRVLYAASSMPVRDLDWFMRPKQLQVLTNRGASGIDGFVSSVLGAALATGPVVALGGDLSMLHDQNGFLLSERPDCVFVIVNNDGGGIFSFLPQARFPESFERGFGTPHGRSFEALAAFHGVDHRLIESPDDLRPEIVEGLERGGLRLIEVVTDRRANVEVHRQATDSVVAALVRARGR